MTSVAFDSNTAQRIVDQTRWAEQNSRSRHDGRNASASFGLNGWWPCQNQDSTDAPPFALAAVVGMSTLANDGRPLILLEKPSNTFCQQYVIIGPQGANANDYGACNFGPAIQFAYDTNPINIGDGWGPKAGQWTASKNMPSCLSPSGVPDTTNKTAWGTLGPINQILCKAVSAIAKGSSGSVTVWAGAPGSEASLGQTLTAWAVQGAIPTGTLLTADFIDGAWYIRPLPTATYGYGTALTTGTTGGWDAYSNYALPIGFPATSTPVNVTLSGSNALVVTNAGEYLVTGQASLGPDWTPNCSGTGFIPGTNQYDILDVSLSAYLNGSPTNTTLSASSDAAGTGAVGFIQITYENSGTPTTTIVPLPPISLSFNTQMTLAAGDALTLVLSSGNVSSGLVSNPQIALGKCQMSIQRLDP